jgi:hypothetical protein
MPAAGQKDSESALNGAGGRSLFRNIWIRAKRWAAE